LQLLLDIDEALHGLAAVAAEMKPHVGGWVDVWHACQKANPGDPRVGRHGLDEICRRSNRGSIRIGELRMRTEVDDQSLYRTVK
jgi:hypothetical protein